MAHEHLAIVKRGVGDALLTGEKRVETRFYRHRRPPYGRIAPGDRVHVKVVGGKVIGSSVVVSVRHFADLTPSVVDRLRRTYQASVRAPDDYWAAKRNSRYAVLIWLAPLAAPPRHLVVPRQHGAGWVLLD